MSVRSARLGDIAADLRSGFACGVDDPEGIIQFRMNNVERDGLLNWTKTRRVPKDMVKNGLTLEPADIILNATNSPDLVGKTALFLGANEPITFSNHFLRIRPRSGVAVPSYIARWLRRHFELGHFKAMCRSWVNQASITKDQVANLEIPLPPLDEQKRIATILDKADLLRQKRRQAIALLGSLTQSIFLEMFGDPVSNPRKWTWKKLSELGTLDRGISKHRPRNDPKLLGGNHPLIQTGDVSDSNGYITSFKSTYSNFGLLQSKIWPPGTLCITIAANIANTGILSFPACFPDSVVGFTGSSRGINEYVRVWLSFLKDTLEKTAPAVAQKNINLAILRDLDVPLPSIGTLKDFDDAMAKLQEERNKLNLYHEKALSLFNSLQHRAFTGQL